LVEEPAFLTFELLSFFVEESFFVDATVERGASVMNVEPGPPPLG
jgi:hypothetical protein